MLSVLNGKQAASQQMEIQECLAILRVHQRLHDNSRRDLCHPCRTVERARVVRADEAISNLDFRTLGSVLRLGAGSGTPRHLGVAVHAT